MEINALLTIAVNDDNVTIEVEDSDASIRFLKLEITPKDFCAALGRLYNSKVKKAKVCGLKYLGKKMEHKKFEFEMPKHTWSNREKLAEITAIEKCPNEWEPDLYFNSQDSFFQKDGKEYAKTTIRRWVDKKNG